MKLVNLVKGQWYFNNFSNFLGVKLDVDFKSEIKKYVGVYKFENGQKIGQN